MQVQHTFTGEREPRLLTLLDGRLELSSTAGAELLSGTVQAVGVHGNVVTFTDAEGRVHVRPL